MGSERFSCRKWLGLFSSLKWWFFYIFFLGIKIVSDFNMCFRNHLMSDLTKSNAWVDLQDVILWHSKMLIWKCYIVTPKDKEQVTSNNCQLSTYFISSTIMFYLIKGEEPQMIAAQKLQGVFSPPFTMQRACNWDLHREAWEIQFTEVRMSSKFRVPPPPKKENWSSLSLKRYPENTVRG